MKATLIIMFSLLCLYQVSAEAALLKAKGGEVKFTAVGKPGFLKIRGESNGAKPEGSIELKKDVVQGEFSFDLKSLKTGIDLRDEHMKDKYLEVGKFPTAKLTIHPMPITEKDLEKNLKREFKGALTLHGVTKEISGSFDYEASSKKLMAQFKVELSDFQIEIPSHMGITVSKTADVEVRIEIEKENSANSEKPRS